MIVQITCKDNNDSVVTDEEPLADVIYQKIVVDSESLLACLPEIAFQNVKRTVNNDATVIALLCTLLVEKKILSLDEIKDILTTIHAGDCLITSITEAM